MITRMGMAPRRNGLSSEAFQAHWRGRHGELAAQLPGVKRYWQNHAVLRDDEPLLPWTGFDACAEIDFPDIATMNAAFVTDLYLKDIREDEAYLIDKTKGGMILADRQALHGGVDGNGIRVLTFMRAASGRTATELQDAVALSPKPADAFASELFRALTPDKAGGHVSIFDAVEALWFEAPQPALRFLTSAEARERRGAFASLVRGVERLIAQVKIVVAAR